MSRYLRPLRVCFAHAAGYSLLINLLLIVPSVYILQVFDRVLTSRSNETLVMLSLLAVGSLLINVVFEVLRGKLLTRAAVSLEASLSPRLLADMLARSVRPTGEFNRHALRDVSSLRNFLTGPGMVALFDLPWLPVYMLLIFAFHPLMGAIALSGGALLFTLAWLNERATRNASQTLQNEARRAHQVADHGLRNAEVVTALGMGAQIATLYARQAEVALGWQLKSGDGAGIFTALSRMLRQLLQVLMMAAGAFLVINLHTSAGVMIAGTLLLGRALAPIDSIIAAWRGFVEARTAYQRIAAQVGQMDQDTARTSLPSPRGALTVERLVFGVAGREAPVLQGVSFELKAGEALGIIGASASGKSTLARLLLGVWQPHSGQVRLDGADLDQWDRHSLGRHLGYLPQDVELFAGTVAQNIARMGEVDDAQVIDAARRAGVHELILRLPQGYDTAIGASGLSLSGGQRQRIALARALYGDPRLVVLDEPNASLDGEGELALLKAMRTLKAAGTTVVVVAHRPALLRDMDKVLMLREGRIECFGARDEVLARVAPSLRRVRSNAPVATPANAANAA